MQQEKVRFRLNLPIEDAFAFALGRSDLSYDEATDEMRQVMGLLVIDNLEYAEQWRLSVQVRDCLATRWPNCAAF